MSLSVPLSSSHQPGLFGDSEIAHRSVREVIGVIRQRFSGNARNENAPEENFEHLAEIFEGLVSTFPKSSTAQPTEQNNAVAATQLTNRANLWVKLKDFLLSKKTHLVVVMVCFVLLCWYFAPLVVSAVGGALLEKLSLLVTGLASFLRSFWPEVVKGALAYFTYFAGTSKMVG